MPTDEQKKEYNRQHYKIWRAKNKDADKQTKMRYYARKIFALDPDQIADLLVPRRASSAK